jgi:plasmid stability protein
MRRLTVDLAEETYRKLKIRCASEDISMVDVVRRLLEDYLKQGEKTKK